MHQRLVIRALTLLTLIASLGLVACGGDSERRRTTPTWQASERLPVTASHWWWEPVERYCEESHECRPGETCQLMQLGTCPTCPRGEDARVCRGNESDSQQANNRR